MGNGMVELTGFKLDTARRCLIRNNAEIELSALEYRLLEYFIHNPNRVLSRDQITENLHGEEFDSFNRAVDILISRLRKKLDDDPKHPEIIKTVHGHGYMFISK
jgi:DNA-binding response OmpR family regulator